MVSTKCIWNGKSNIINKLESLLSYLKKKKCIFFISSATSINQVDDKSYDFWNLKRKK